MLRPQSQSAGHMNGNAGEVVEGHGGEFESRRHEEAFRIFDPHAQSAGRSVLFEMIVSTVQTNAKRPRFGVKSFYRSQIGAQLPTLVS